LIFTRNPVLGQCKTRLAKTIGDRAALDIYIFLLEHTAKVAHGVKADIRVYYSDEIIRNDCWEETRFEKRKQRGSDLGDRMKNAFAEGFSDGYKSICIMGSDLYDIDTPDIQEAFDLLSEKDAVIGPAEDGGYYLLGMKELIPGIFENMAWGTDDVLPETLKRLASLEYEELAVRNDIDYYEDIADIDAFQPFLNNLKL
jgi:hypothetical protein